MLFHRRRVNVIPFTSIRKLRPFLADFHETDECLTAIRATSHTEFYPSRTIRGQYGQIFFDVPQVKYCYPCPDLIRNSHSPSTFLWKSSVPNVIQEGRKIQRIRTEFHLYPYVMYNYAPNSRNVSVFDSFFKTLIKEFWKIRQSV